jgi:Arm DNA-binding domain
MGKLTAISCETSKPKKDRDKLIGDGDGLFLRIRPDGTKAWVVEYEFKGEGRKHTIGSYDPNGAPGASIEQWLRHRRLSLTQARTIAGEWKAARSAGHDPIAEWEAQLVNDLVYP